MAQKRMRTIWIEFPGYVVCGYARRSPSPLQSGDRRIRPSLGDRLEQFLRIEMSWWFTRHDWTKRGRAGDWHFGARNVWSPPEKFCYSFWNSVGFPWHSSDIFHPRSQNISKSALNFPLDKWQWQLYLAIPCISAGLAFACKAFHVQSSKGKWIT